MFNLGEMNFGRYNIYRHLNNGVIKTDYILFIAAELNYKIRNYVAKKIDDKRMRRKAMKL